MFADKTVTHHTQGWSKMIRRSKSKVKVRKVSMAVNSPARKPVVSRLSRYPPCHKIMAKISLPHLSKGPCDLNPSVIKEKEPPFFGHFFPSNYKLLRFLKFQLIMLWFLDLTLALKKFKRKNIVSLLV